MIGNMEVIADPSGVGQTSASVYRGDGVGMSWFYDHLGGQDDSIRSETLLRQGTVWAGVNIIAGDMGQIPYRVMVVDGDSSEENRSHPVARLFRNGPNYWQTTDQWLEWMTATAIIWGNAISRIVRDQRGRVVSLVPIPPIYIDWNVLDGVPYYVVSTPDGAGELLQLSDVVHIKTLSTTGFWGLRLAEVAHNELQLDKSAKCHAASVFKNGTFPGGVLEHPGKLSPEARKQLRAEWEAVHGGGQNSGRTAVLWEGMNYNPQSVTPADAQLIEVLSHDAVMVGKLLQISPIMLGDLRNASTRANVEEEFKQYYSRTLRRRVNALANELQRKLVSRQDIEIVPDPTEILKGDMHTQVEVANALYSGKLATKNEARRTLGMNPVDGGDIFENPAIDTNKDSEPNDPSERETSDGVVAASRRIRRTEARKLSNAAKTSRNFVSYVERFYAGPFMELVRSEVPDAGELADYQQRRRLTVVEMSGQFQSSEELAKHIESEATEPDALALSAYIRGI